MTQSEHDRLFDKLIKIGLTMTIAGFAAAAISAVVFAMFGSIIPFVVAVSVGIIGGMVCNGVFYWDIMCNSRWKR